jgi:hypothetical protein
VLPGVDEELRQAELVRCRRHGAAFMRFGRAPTTCRTGRKVLADRLRLGGAEDAFTSSSLVQWIVLPSGPTKRG